jgi:hypothetical protein
MSEDIAIPLPDRPDLRHLKDQARDMVRSGAAPSLSNAQFQIARQYGFASWPKLKSHVDSLKEIGQLRIAIDEGDLARVQALMTRNPKLHQAPLGYNKNGPLTWVAECRGIDWAKEGQIRLDMARWMIEHGSDIHQGGDGPLMRAALQDRRIPMMELLVQYGADVNALWDGRYPIICAPCETLEAEALRWLLEHGAKGTSIAEPYGLSALPMVLSTYARNPKGKHTCLAVLAEYGFPLPETPAMAFHRGRIDLLEEYLAADPSFLSRQYDPLELFPTELGIGDGEGLYITPIAGATLLHLAIEYDEMGIAEWALEKGADVNARAGMDSEGFGGHTPLFHSVVSWGRRDDAKARFLLDHGADPNARATFRKQMKHMGDPEKETMRVYQNVTPISYTRQFVEPMWVSEPAVGLIAERGGVE